LPTLLDGLGGSPLDLLVGQRQDHGVPQSLASEATIFTHDRQLTGEATFTPITVSSLAILCASPRGLVVTGDMRVERLQERPNLPGLSMTPFERHRQTGLVRSALLKRLYEAIVIPHWRRPPTSRERERGLALVLPWQRSPATRMTSREGDPEDDEAAPA